MRRCSFVRCVALSPSYPSGGWCLLGAGRGRWAMALPGRSGWTGWAVVSSRASIGEMVDGVGEDTAECKKAACGGDIRWALLLGAHLSTHPLNHTNHLSKPPPAPPSTTMCHEWTRVWQCNHGATPQEAPTLSLCTLGKLNLADLAACDPNCNPAARDTQMRAACAYIEDVRILQEGWCRRCQEERRRDPKAFEARELCWKDERPGSFL
ncbi:hypothetical protein IWX49DRAFT_386021 [Phyllosticta citricarpa]|uniref:Uncharacterized protein n=1 Tax=Phyllosticta paracitricarpa TaxID=2016321 RepID=A0ABR1N5V5_9PEZI